MRRYRGGRYGNQLRNAGVSFAQTSDNEGQKRKKKMKIRPCLGLMGSLMKRLGAMDAKNWDIILDSVFQQMVQVS